MEHSPRLWSVKEAAKYLRIPISSVYKMTSKRSTNPIPHVKLGGRLRFRKADIDRWLELWAVSSVERLERAKKRAASR